MANSLKYNELLQSDRKGYIESIDQLQNQITELEKQIDGSREEVTKANLSQENWLRLCQKSKSDLEDYITFVKKIKALVYRTELSEISNISSATLDTIYASVADTFNDLRRKPEPKVDSELEKENIKLKEILNDYNDKYTKIIERKNQFITSLQTQCENMKKTKDDSIDISTSEEYLKLQELKAKDQESYEGEIKELKTAIADTDAQKVKDSAFMAKLKRDNLTLFKKNKTLNTAEEEKTQLTTDLEQTKQSQSDLQQKLDQTHKDLEEAHKKLKLAEEKPEKINIEESNFKDKYTEIIKKLEADLQEQRAVNTTITEKLATMEKQLPKEPNNTMKNLVRAFNLIKKSRKILDIVQSRHATPIKTVAKPPTSIIKKRVAKDQDKQNDSTPKVQKTDE